MSRVEELQARITANPMDSEAAVLLQQAYSQIGDYQNAITFTEQFAPSFPPEVAAHLYFEGGRIAHEQAQDFAKAVTFFQYVLHYQPTNLQATEHLILALRPYGDFDRIVEALVHVASAFQQAADNQTAAQLLTRAAETTRDDLKNTPAALALFTQAYTAYPKHVPALYAARIIHHAGGETTKARELLTLECDAEADPVRRVALLRELAQSHRETNDTNAARDALEQALQLGGAPNSLKFDLADLISNIDASSDDEKRMAAGIFAELSDKTDSANSFTLLSRALDLAPDNADALQRLEAAASQLGRIDEMPNRWERFIALTEAIPPTRDRRFWLARARVAEGRTEDAITALAPLQNVGDAAAAAELYDLHRGNGDFVAALESLEIAESVLTESVRVERMHDLLDGLHLVGAEEQVIGLSKKIIELNPLDETAIEQLRDHYRKSEKHEELVELLTTVAMNTTDNEIRGRHLREAASLAENELADRESAISIWNDMLIMSPGSQDAFRSLERLLRMEEDWDGLADSYLRHLQATVDSNYQIQLLESLIEIQESKRGNREGLAFALRELSELRPDDQTLRNELAEILLELGRRGDALPLLIERARLLVDITKKSELLNTVAEIYQDDLGNIQESYATAQSIIELDPGNDSALARMESIDRGGEHHARLVETLLKKIPHQENDDAEETRFEIATLYRDKLSNIDEAIEQLKILVMHNLSHERGFEALRELYHQEGRHEELISQLRERVNAEDDDVARNNTIKQIARLLQEQLMELPRAASTWEEVRSNTPEDVDALRALVDIYRTLNDETTLEARLRALCEVTPLEEERSALTKEHALLLRQLEKDDEARQLLESYCFAKAHNLSEHSTDLDALQTLALWCRNDDDKKALVNALERQLELIESPALQLPVVQELANVSENDLADTELAIRALEQWIECDASDEQPRRRLIELLRASNDHAKLVAQLDGLKAIAEEADERLILELEAGRIEFRKLEQSAEAWLRIRRLADQTDEAEELAREIALGSEQADALAQLYVEWAREGGNLRLGARDSWMKAADVYESESKNASNALESVLRALAEEPADRTLLDHVDRLAILSQSWERLERVYGSLIQQGQPAVELELRLATILRDEAQRHSAAFNYVVRAAEREPDNDAVIELGETLAAEASRLPELLLIYERRAAKSPAKSLDALLRAYQIAADELKDKARSRIYLEQLVSTNLGDHESIEKVEEAALSSAKNNSAKKIIATQLAEIYSGVASTRRGMGEASASLLMRCHRLLAEVVSDRSGAWKAISAAAKFTPNDQAILDQLEEAASSQKRNPELSRIYAGFISDAMDQKSAAMLLRRQASLLDFEIKDKSKAIDAYRALLRFEPNDVEGRAALENALRANEDHNDLITLLEQQAKDENLPLSKRIGKYIEAAELWEDAVGNRFEAFDVWQKILTLDPENTQGLEGKERLQQAIAQAPGATSQRPKRAARKTKAAKKEEIDSVVAADDSATVDDVVSTNETDGKATKKKKRKSKAKKAAPMMAEDPVAEDPVVDVPVSEPTIDIDSAEVEPLGGATVPPEDGVPFGSEVTNPIKTSPETNDVDDDSFEVSFGDVELLPTTGSTLRAGPADDDPLIAGAPKLAPVKLDAPEPESGESEHSKEVSLDAKEMDDFSMDDYQDAFGDDDVEESTEFLDFDEIEIVKD